jgi:hypothetical protein
MCFRINFSIYVQNVIGSFKKNLLFIYSHVHTLFGSFPPPTALLPHFKAEPVLPLSLILLKRRHKHNKKEKALLLVELRTAIQKDS